MVDRKVLLEYTRKMSLKKHCIHRVHMSNLKAGKTVCNSNFSIGAAEPRIQTKELAIAKTVPFSKGLKEKKFTTKGKEYRRLLEGLLSCELKNEALGNVASEVFASKCKGAKSVHLFYGVYEIPQKRVYEQGSSAFVTENESGEVYPHLICVVLSKDGEMLHGLMYPAYREGRYGDKDRYNCV